MSKGNQVAFLLVLAGFCLGATANAELAITEIMSQSLHDHPTDCDWWELTNTGGASVDLTGYSWDDVRQRIGQNLFESITIAAGESIIIRDVVAAPGEPWKGDWGLGAEVNVYDPGYFYGSFSSLGASDGVFLYDTGNVLVASVTYPARMSGLSNEWAMDGTFLGLSVVGENGAYQSANVIVDVASPGYAPQSTPCSNSGRIIYWTDKDSSKIQRMNIDGGCVEDILTSADGLVDPRGLAIDAAGEKMYWAENGTGKIHRSNLDGSNVEGVAVGLSYPADIALDPGDGKVYWADRDAGKIQRKNLDGAGATEDVITGIYQPYYLALDLVNGKIYWSDFDGPVIHRANLDGTAMENFIPGLDRVRDIALDVADGKIYWGDRDTSKIQRANLDGTAIEDLFGPADGLDRPHGLALNTAIGKMFWTDTATHTVYIANMDGSGTAASIATGLSGPWGIAFILMKQIIYVDTDAPGPFNDGSNWNDAYLYLQDALDAAANGDEIRVGQGTCIPDRNSTNPNGSGSREATFQLINGVTLKGGYAGYGAADPDERNIERFETILSGDLSGNDQPGFVNSDDNSYHVVTGGGANETTILDGFTITAGNADGPGHSEGQCGGGMYNYENASPTVINCTFMGNQASQSGGGMYNRSQSNLTHPTLTNCTFTGNYADATGGAIMFHIGNDEFATVLTNCLFNGNSADAMGGAINNLGGNMILNNCTFVGNSAGYAGAMRIVESGRQIATNCIFWGNLPTTFAGDSDGSLDVTYSLVQGNFHDRTEGNIDTDPLFANPDNGDFHLKSQGGRYGPASEGWVIDAVTSPGIDAGDMADPVGHERFPNGGIINMGAYGGTAEASKSYFGEPVCDTIFAGDINGDCRIDLADLSFLALHWLEDNNP